MGSTGSPAGFVPRPVRAVHRLDRADGGCAGGLRCGPPLGRMLRALVHRVLLIPPRYVKPFVKRGKNDRIDAAAICEAAGRLGRSVVPVRSLEAQSRAIVLRFRKRLMHQRTQLTHAIRGHAAEFGLVGARGTRHMAELMARISAGSEVPAAVRKRPSWPTQCMAAVREPHLGQRPPAAQTGRTHDRFQTDVTIRTGLNLRGRPHKGTRRWPASCGP